MMQGAYRSLKEYLKLDECGCDTVNQDYFTVEEFDERVLERFDIDFRRVFLGGSAEYRKTIGEDGTWVDEMGFTRRFSGMYGEQVDHPLRRAAGPADIKNHRFFNAYDPARTHGLRERVEHLYHQTDYAVVAAGAVGGILETSNWMRGFDQFPVDLMLDRRMAHALLGRLTEYYIELMDAFLSVVGPYVQMVELADDLGGQNNLLVSPQLYEEMILPYYKRLIDFIRTKTDAKVFHHSCGSVTQAAQLLVDAGVDILNSLQPRAAGMDSTFLKDRYGERLSFHGGVDIQDVLPNGTPAEVEDEVKRRLAIYAPSGGYVVCAAHCIQDDVPPGNLVAMYEAAERWGGYPLSEDLTDLRRGIPNR